MVVEAPQPPTVAGPVVSNGIITPDIADTTISAVVSSPVGIKSVEFFIGSASVGKFDAGNKTNDTFSIKIGKAGYSCQPTKVVAIGSNGAVTTATGTAHCTDVVY